MLSTVSRFGNSKGMVAMPNLVGLTRDAAILTVTNAGLLFTSSNNVDSTSANNGKVTAQAIASGTLLDYESSITFSVGVYTAPAGPVITYVIEIDTTTGLPKVYEVDDGLPYCVTTSSPYLQSQKRKNVNRKYTYSDGVKTSTYEEVYVSAAPTITTAYVKACGAPSDTCGADYIVGVTAWTACNGYHSRTEKVCKDCTVSGTVCGPQYNTGNVPCCYTVSSSDSCGKCSCTATKSCMTTTTTMCGTTSTTATTGPTDKPCTWSGTPCA